LLCGFAILNFTFIHLADAFIQSDLQLYVRGCTPLEQLRVKYLAQGHIGVSVDSNLGLSHQRHVSGHFEWEF